MTSAQKVIKYIAIAFAIFLIVTIISSVLTAFYGVSYFLGLRKEETVITEDMVGTSFLNKNTDDLEIDVKFTNLIIKTGEELKFETNNRNIICTQNNNDMEITEKEHNWFSKSNQGDLIIYIPDDMEFEKVKINAGAGKVNIQNLETKKLEIELGAGETLIQNINVSKECNIEGGAGSIEVLNGTINDLDLDIGVGKLDLNAILTGKTKVNAGIGNLSIKVPQSKEKYEIKVDKGIGSIKIDGKEVQNGAIYGDGENSIDVNGGIGNIDIKFN